MKVSIQIPTFNQEKFIAQAIESALAQTYPDLEIIVLDDFSTDNTYAIANSYNDNRLKVFKNDKNIGRVKNYHRLLYEFVTGEWIINLDGDDQFIDRYFISSGMAQIEKTEKVVFYQAAIIGKTRHTEFLFKHDLLGDDEYKIFSGKFYFKNFHKNGFFSHLATIYNAKKAREIGFYSHDTLIADAESMLKLSLHGQVLLSNQIVGIWNIHSNNESKTIFTQNSNTIKALERLKNYAESYIGIPAAAKWFRSGVNSNTKSYMEELAKSDFEQFLRMSLSKRYFTRRWVILIIKKLFGKIN